MFSLGEIESQCKKAARGSGLSWGLAEDAGLVARLLSEVGLPGSETIALNLKKLAFSELYRVEKKEDIFGAAERPLSGFLIGISILDRLSEFPDSKTVDFGEIVGPLAFVGSLLKLQGSNYSFSVRWVGFHCCLDSTGLTVHGKNLNPEIVHKLEFSIFQNLKISSVNEIVIPKVSVECWKELTDLAYRTYVPSSEKSRMFGAGAGVLDND